MLEVIITFCLFLILGSFIVAVFFVPQSKYDVAVKERNAYRNDWYAELQENMELENKLSRFRRKRGAGGKFVK